MSRQPLVLLYQNSPFCYIIIWMWRFIQSDVLYTEIFKLEAMVKTFDVLQTNLFYLKCCCCCCWWRRRRLHSWLKPGTSLAQSKMLIVWSLTASISWLSCKCQPLAFYLSSFGNLYNVVMKKLTTYSSLSLIRGRDNILSTTLHCCLSDHIIILYHISPLICGCKSLY